ncbi:MAG TPA: hypothetical protein VER97_01095 [Geodermatophilus sp.]|nr:hypothetical protein [Geodermatophilus sp.]
MTAERDVEHRSGGAGESDAVPRELSTVSPDGSGGAAAPAAVTGVDAAPPPERSPAAGHDASTGDRHAEEDSGFGWIVGVLVVAGFLVIGNWESVADFVVRWRWLIGAAVVTVAVLLLMPIGRRWLANRTASTRAALLIFVVVPLLLGGVGSVVVLPQQHQLTALRVVFLLVVCLLPATMWYFFIAARKASLLNEFLSNLQRLGLLDHADREDDAAHARRIWSYLQRFEAVYGDVPDDVYSAAVDGCFVPYKKSDLVATTTTLSTATVPVMMSTVLVALGWLITLPPGRVVSEGNDLADAFEPVTSPVTLAFLGAYFFTLQLLFRRYVLKDLRGSAYTAVSMRIIVAIIGIWILGSVDSYLQISQEQLLVLGFAIGVFPKVLWQVLESAFKRTIGGIALPSMRSDLPISDLDGLTVWHEARLEEEDMESLANMATADVVELFLNTRLPRERIVDWVDQAILYTQLGPQSKKYTPRKALRVHGIRTATSFLAVHGDGQGGGHGGLDLDAALLGVGRAASLAAALRTNSNLQLISSWRQAGGSAGRRAVGT